MLILAYRGKKVVKVTLIKFDNGMEMIALFLDKSKELSIYKKYVFLNLKTNRHFPSAIKS
jgi:hypothetical protein